MHRPKVSVIIPVYNTEPYLHDTVRSILEQSEQDLEVIIVNDGSTDDSLKIASAIARQDSRVRLIDQHNQGISVARNAGVEVATGEFIYFMDSDDLLDHETLAACYQKCKAGNLDFVFFDAEVFGDGYFESAVQYRRTHLLVKQVASGREMLQHQLSTGAYLSSACLSFINAGFLKKAGLSFHPGILHEDELFTFQLYISASAVSFLPKAYFKRRLRPGSIMISHYSRKNIDSYLFVFSKMKELKGKDDYVNRLVDQRISGMIISLLYNCRSLTLKTRLYTIRRCIIEFGRYVRPKDAIVALLPFLSKTATDQS